jgi:hypothetical protein
MPDTKSSPVEATSVAVRARGRPKFGGPSAPPLVRATTAIPIATHTALCQQASAARLSLSAYLRSVLTRVTTR